MMFFQIPARNDLPNYSFRINLSGTNYTFDFHYNVRMSRWILDISDASGNPILSGIALLILRDLTRQYVTLAIPPGVIFATDDTQQDTQPTTYSFGSDHSLFYEDPTQ